MSKSYEIRTKPIGETTFCLQFFEKGDRFAHRIFAETSDHCVELLNSVEGTDEDWPLSPPLQHMHAQEMESGSVVMGVGMAGTGHWSASCQLDQSEDRVRFLFDVACRIKSTPMFLGSTYAGAMIVDEKETKSKCGFGCQYRALSLEDGSVISSTDNSQAFWVVHSEVEIKQARILAPVRTLQDPPIANEAPELPPVSVATKNAPQTIRWHYAIEFQQSVE